MFVEEKERKTLINDTFKEVIIKNYWDSHGKQVAWKDETGKTQRTFKNAKVLLEEVKKVYHFEYTGDHEFDAWDLTINGEKYNGEITGYKGSGDQLVLKACIGAG